MDSHKMGAGVQEAIIWANAIKERSELQNSREQMKAEPTFKFTWPHKMWPNGEGQYSGPDKKYIQWQRNEFKKLGYKVSKVIEVEQNNQKRDK